MSAEGRRRRIAPDEVVLGCAGRWKCGESCSRASFQGRRILFQPRMTSEASRPAWCRIKPKRYHWDVYKLPLSEHAASSCLDTFYSCHARAHYLCTNGKASTAAGLSQQATSSGAAAVRFFSRPALNQKNVGIGSTPKIQPSRSSPNCS